MFCLENREGDWIDSSSQLEDTVDGVELEGCRSTNSLGLAPDSLDAIPRGVGAGRLKSKLNKCAVQVLKRGKRKQYQGLEDGKGDRGHAEQQRSYQEDKILVINGRKRLVEYKKGEDTFAPKPEEPCFLVLSRRTGGEWGKDEQDILKTSELVKPRQHTIVKAFRNHLLVSFAQMEDMEFVLDHASEITDLDISEAEEAVLCYQPECYVTVATASPQQLIDKLHPPVSHLWKAFTFALFEEVEKDLSTPTSSVTVPSVLITLLYGAAESNRGQMVQASLRDEGWRRIGVADEVTKGLEHVELYQPPVPGLPGLGLKLSASVSRGVQVTLLVSDAANFKAMVKFYKEMLVRSTATCEQSGEGFRYLKIPIHQSSDLWIVFIKDLNPQPQPNVALTFEKKHTTPLPRGAQDLGGGAWKFSDPEGNSVVVCELLKSGN